MRDAIQVNIQACRYVATPIPFEGSIEMSPQNAQAGETRVCPGCHIEKPIDQYSKDVSQRRCKTCLREHSRRYRERHPAKVRERSRQYLEKLAAAALLITTRVCPICHVEKQLDQFLKQKSNARGPCNACRAERAAAARKASRKAYYLKHKDKFAEYARQRYQKRKVKQT